jgi:anaerobic ribonucleoside-triphosphate reductase
MPTPNPPSNRKFFHYCQCQRRTTGHDAEKEGNETVYVCPVCGSRKHCGVGQLLRKTPYLPLRPIA